MKKHTKHNVFFTIIVILIGLVCSIGVMNTYQGVRIQQLKTQYPDAYVTIGVIKDVFNHGLNEQKSTRNSSYNCPPTYLFSDTNQVFWDAIIYRNRR